MTDDAGSHGLSPAKNSRSVKKKPKKITPLPPTRLGPVSNGIWSLWGSWVSVEVLRDAIGTSDKRMDCSRVQNKARMNSTEGPTTHLRTAMSPASRPARTSMLGCSATTTSRRKPRTAPYVKRETSNVRKSSTVCRGKASDSGEVPVPF